MKGIKNNKYKNINVDKAAIESTRNKKVDCKIVLYMYCVFFDSITAATASTKRKKKSNVQFMGTNKNKQKIENTRENC